MPPMRKRASKGRRVRKGSIRRKFSMPNYPPSISVNPWRKVTIAVEDEGDATDKCVTVKSMVKSLVEQIGCTIAKCELRVHRVRIWNRGTQPTYDAAKKVEIPAKNGPLALNTVDLVSTMGMNECKTFYFKTLEGYPGLTSWAKVSFTWPATCSKLILGHNDDAIIFTWRAPKGETCVFHVVVSYRAQSSGTFTESTLRCVLPNNRNELSSDKVDAAMSPASSFERIAL